MKSYSVNIPNKPKDIKYDWYNTVLRLSLPRRYFSNDFLANFIIGIEKILTESLKGFKVLEHRWRVD